MLLTANILLQNVEEPYSWIMCCCFKFSYLKTPVRRIDLFNQTGSNINNDNINRELDYKHLIKYYNLLQKMAKTTHCRNIS